MGSFTELLMFYLNSTFVGWNEAMYVQKYGIRIGSKVAPLVRDIFLARVDQKIHHAIQGLAKRVFRFVDYFIILMGLIIGPML